MADQALWITEAEVAALFDLRDAIAALERGLADEAAGAAVNMEKTHATFGHGDTLHAIGATMTAQGMVGTKTWAHTEGGANPLLILFDAADGRLLAVIEAFALGQLRTAAISGIATGRLAAPHACEMEMVARGAHINAVGAVVPERAEFEPSVLARCAVVAADTPAAVHNLSHEFREFCGNDDRAWDSVLPLSRVLVTGGGRPADADLTLFKAMGMGISDLSVGVEVLRRARAGGVGRALAQTRRARPRFAVNQM